jgi:HlyD family secretion protein
MSATRQHDVVIAASHEMKSGRRVTDVTAGRQGASLLPVPIELVNRRDIIPVQLTQSYRSLRRSLFLSLFLVAGLGSGGVAGGSLITISGAVIANGLMVVDTSSKKVQHPTGGVVKTLNVREGDHVKAGDVVLSLDDTLAKAGLAVVAHSYAQQQARLARLVAERDGETSISFPADLLAQAAGDAKLSTVIGSETKLFEARAQSRQGQKDQLNEQIKQSNESIDGYNTQLVSKQKEFDLSSDELVGVRALYQKKLTSIQRVNELERNLAQVSGAIGALRAQMAVERGRIAEYGLKILQVDQDLQTEVGKDITDTEATIRELAEKKAAAEDTLRRIDLPAPMSGVVHELNVHTVGGVVEAGEVLMMIVPDADKLVAEVKIRPSDIDLIHPEQKAVITFSTFDRATTPRLDGELASVSPDLINDEANRTAYYKARISLTDAEIARLGGEKLVAGMPLEAFIKTSDRTLGSYLVKPITDQIRKAFRER